VANTRWCYNPPVAESGSEIRYARNGDLHIAFRAIGSGPVDIVLVGSYFSDLEIDADNPITREFDQRLEGIGRTIYFDARGTGLSDRLPGSRLATLEERASDMLAVLDAARSERPIVVSLASGGPACCLFAATHPDRTLGLVLCNTAPRMAWAPDYPWGTTPEEYEQHLVQTRQEWGTLAMAEREVRQSFPSRADEPGLVEFLARRMRRSAAPGDAVRLVEMLYDSDVRHVLPAIHVPTLVLSRGGELADESRAMAAQIPGAEHLIMPGTDYAVMGSHADAYADAIEEFVARVRDEEASLDRVLATVMYTDIVGSTARAAEIGDRAWSQLLEEHHSRVRAQLARFRGREIDTAGDGFLAAFDGPARAIRCALTIHERMRELGIHVRIGLHTGECERAGDRLRGLALHIGARVAAKAQADEVLVSGTVKDLVAGAGFEFEPRGEEELKGVPGTWRLFRVNA
jgi:class 3 adenylate cyclase